MKVITQPHPYSIWGNVKIPEDLEFDIPNEIADELISRGFAVEKETHLAKQAQEKSNVEAYLKAKEEKRLAAIKPAREPEKVPEPETKKTKKQKE